MNRLAPPRTSDVTADVIVVGGGIIGLAIAAALAEADASVALLTDDRPGAASRAAAGLLVPHYSREDVSPAVSRFMVAARDLYPQYVQWAEELSGLSIPFDRSGAIEIAPSAAEWATLRDARPGDAECIGPDTLSRIEPALAPAVGALLHPRDGAVDNVRLTDALASIVSASGRVRTLQEPVIRVRVGAEAAAAVTGNGTRIAGRRLVLAAGAWAGLLQGLPRPLPVRPMRGQMCVVRGAPLRHVVLASDAYMVSRGGDRTLIGSTMEDVGFDPATSPAAIFALHGAAARVCPAIGEQPVVGSWSGLRPATPDLLPVLGADRDCPALVYACGHSRNGILLAPITAAVIRGIVLDGAAGWDVGPFSIGRFDRQ